MKIDAANRQLANTTTQIFARAFNALNSTTGNAAMEVRNALRQGAKQVSESTRQAASSIGSSIGSSSIKSNVENYTRAHPLAMLGGAFAAGLLISYALHRARNKALAEAASHEEG